MTKMLVKKGKKGQTLVEYGLIIALISVALIAALGLLQGQISTTFASAGTAMGS